MNIDSAEKMVNLANRYVLAGDLVTARQYLEEAINYDPNYQPVYFAFANLHIAMKDFRMAEEYATRGINNSPVDAACWESRAQARLYLVDVDGARADSMQALVFNPRAVTAHIILSTVYIMDAQAETAVKLLLEAAEIEPANVNIWLGLSSAFLLEGKVAESSSSLQRALAIEPNNWRIYHELANIEIMCGEFASALTHINQAFSLGGNSPDLYKMRGTCQVISEEWQKAEADFREAIKLNPNDAYSWMSLAEVKFQLVQTVSAEAKYRISEHINKAMSLNHTESITKRVISYRRD